jgi:hypothetical protein
MRIILVSFFLSLLIIGCITSSSMRKKQCKGVELDGSRCSVLTNNDNGYCYKHQEQAGKSKTSTEIDSLVIKRLNSGFPL